MRFFILSTSPFWCLGACGGATDTDTDTDTDVSDADADADADSDTDTDADSDADTDPDGFFLEASGTWDGVPFETWCDESHPFLGGAAVGTSINLGCTDVESGFSVALGMVGGGVGTSTTCGFGSSVQVTQVGTGAYVACVLTPPTSFAWEVTEYTVEADGSVVWAGTFQMSADDGTHATEVEGSFHGRSVAY